MVILYNPSIEIVDNISSYINQVDRLFIINNSDLAIPYLNEIKDYSYKIIVVNNNSNLGLATALNQGATLAINDGFEYLLTLDQDSRVSENLVIELLHAFDLDTKIGIVAPFIIHKINPRYPDSTVPQSIAIAMTSGSLLKLSMFKVIGEFDSKLFIDYIDYEYSLRVHMNDYKIIQIKNAFVYHQLGNATVRRFLWWKFFPTNHSAKRLFYRTRNRFYLYRKYKNLFPEFVQNDKKQFFKEIVKIILLENHKLEKIKMIFLGYKEFSLNKNLL